MRKIISTIFIICFISTILFSANDFFVSFTGNYMIPSDSVYRNVYGSGEFYPEFKAGVRAFNNVYAWAGYGFLSAKGQTYPKLKLDAEASKKFLSAGLAYRGKGKITFGIEAGFFSVNWEEKTMSRLNKGAAIGFRIGGGVIYNWSPTFFTEISSAYLFASDKIEDVKFKIGGFTAGVGAGFRF